MLLQDIHQLVAGNFAQVDLVMQAGLNSEVSLINDITKNIIQSGGKRFRPLIVLLSAHACGYKGDEHIKLAAIIEFIHTATLLHDDVIDLSLLRRGVKTANAIWGNKSAILVGDYLYSRAFQIMVQLNSLEVMAVLAKASNLITEGEVLQLMHNYNPNISEATYLTIVHHKTATLFEAAAQLGAIISKAPLFETHLLNYGYHLGMAFQLIDDALDYGVNSPHLGKNTGGDLREGKPTLPLIYLLQHGSASQKQLAIKALAENNNVPFATIQEAIESSGAIAYTIESARRYAIKAQQALQGLPDTPYKVAAHALASLAVERVS